MGLSISPSCPNIVEHAANSQARGEPVKADRYDYNQDQNRIAADMVAYDEINKTPKPSTAGSAACGVVAVVVLLVLNWLMITYPTFFAWLGSLK